METQKTVNLLNDSNNLQQKNGILLAVKQKVITYPIMKLIFLTSSLESSLCDYSDAYILDTENITVTGENKYMQIQKLHLKIVHHLKRNK